MAQRMLSFIHSRAPRAIGVSDEAIDEHRELIRDLYLTRNYTRNQVIAYLKTELDFDLSADATTNTPSNVLCCTTDEEHPATALDPSSLPCPPEKQPKPRSDLDDIVAQSPWLDLDIGGDGDITMSSPAEEKSIEPSLFHQLMSVAQPSAEYLACCYLYTEAFNYYSTIFIFCDDKMCEAKKRRASLLDLARVAKTGRSCELVRLMLETEIEMSNDPLAEEGHTQSSSEETDMCRMQSFLFHRHLAQIYARQNDGAISMQKHLDNARNFTKTFETDGTASIDLWALLFLVRDKADTGIPEDLLGSLQWDFESYALNIENCLRYCWRKLNPTELIDEACKGYYTDQQAKTELTEMSYLALETSAGYLWKRTSILFTFLWKETQLAHGTLPWVSGHPTISPAHILLIVSRIIVKRLCLISKHKDDLPNRKKYQVKIRPKNPQLYCDALLGFFHDILFAPDEAKREFATHFVEHHTWSPPSDPRRTLVSHTQSYQIEALEYVWAAKRVHFKVDQFSALMEVLITSSKATSEDRRASTNNDLSSLLRGQVQRAFVSQRPADSYIHVGCHPPASHSSRNSSYFKAALTSHGIYLGVLRGNPTISRPLASHSSCSSQWSASSSLQRFKAAALSWQHQPEAMLTLPEDSDVRMDDEIDQHA
ncbi:uncharacterized protein QYS62_003998 [Fusarium acuminatum]|uniref:Clr5 domain-containing protein n=1 Tax=Fusarium acuminatum TaxID=5515 RepID=A0ABZ2WST1_9HYPO